MKTKIIATLALAAAATGLVSTAKASDRFSVSFGVTSGPIYTAAPAPVYVPAPVADNCPPTTTVVAAPAYNYSVGYSNGHSRGHWENVTRKVWVPERWVTSRDRFGRPVRVLERGYFTYRNERVWVDGSRYGYRG